MCLKNLVSRLTFIVALASGGELLADQSVGSLQIGPETQDPVCLGRSASYSVTITATNSNSGALDFDLSTLGLPPGATATFSPSSIKIVNKTSPGTATLVISTTNTIMPGSYPFSVMSRDSASGNTITNTATLNVGPCLPWLVQDTNGCWCYTFGTQPGNTYQIQVTTSLCPPNWTTLCTTNAGIYSFLVFMDADKAFYSIRFYRAVMQ
jgi:hypothetical protein